jgi:hypothetical protein
MEEFRWRAGLHRRKILKAPGSPPDPKKRNNQSRRRGIFNLKGVAYQGTREASGLWSRGGPLLELGLVRIHLVGVVRLLLPLRFHVGVVSVAGVAALLLLLDLVLWHMVTVLIKVNIFWLLKKERIHANKRGGSGKKKNNVLRIRRRFTDPDAM